MLARLLSTETKAKLILGAIGTGAAGWLLLPGGETPEAPPAAQVAQADGEGDSPSAVSRAAKNGIDSEATDSSTSDGSKEKLFGGSKWDENASAGASDEPAAREGNDWPTDDQVTPVGGAAASDDGPAASSDPFAAPSYRDPPAGAGASADDSGSADPFAAPNGAGSSGGNRYGAPAAGWGEPADTSTVAEGAANTVPPLKQLDQGTAPGTLPPLPPLDDEEGYSASDLGQGAPAVDDENPLRSSRNAASGFDGPSATDATASAAESSDDPFAAPSAARAASSTATVGDETGDEPPGQALPDESNPFAAPSLPRESEAGVPDNGSPEWPAEAATEAAAADDAGSSRVVREADPFAGDPPPAGRSFEPREERLPAREFAPAKDAVSEDAAPGFTSPRIGAPVGDSAAPPAFTQPPAATRTVDGTYTSRGGESLFDVARRELGSPARWVEIYELNESQLGSTARRLPKGLRLRMPER